MRIQHTHSSYRLKGIKQGLAAMFMVQRAGSAKPCPTTEQITALRAAIYNANDDLTPVHSRADAGTGMQRGHRRALA